ncbi:MAG: hypothetical protein LM580_11990 [Thermofilum sp.]|nr:hypothetical protein [Thermofilum sp.]
MRVMEARLVLKSPAVVVQRRTERGFVKPADWIPGSMLRGAILTALYRAGKLSAGDLERERVEPSLLASPAYPVVKGSRSAPATPFMFYCRRCKTVVDITREAAERLARGEEPKPPLPHECGEALKPMHGALVAREGRELRRASVETFRSTSVAIGRDRGSAVRGMLFDYEAIAEGTEFWAWVLAPDWLQPGSMEVAVGRGASRGFGWAELRLEPAQQPPQHGGVLVAMSPLTPLKRLEWRGCALTLARVYGRLDRLQAGWEYGRGFRPIVEVARRGSLAVVEEVSGSVEPLRVGLPVRAGDSWLTGFNALVPLEEYYGVLGG